MSASTPSSTGWKASSGSSRPAVVVTLRRAAGEGFFGRLMDCFYCLSLWTAAPVAWVIGATHTERVLLWLAASGGAILVERFSEEHTHGVLRTTAGDGLVERKTG